MPKTVLIKRLVISFSRTRVRRAYYAALTSKVEGNERHTSPIPYYKRQRTKPHKWPKATKHA